MIPFGGENRKHFNLKDAEEFRERFFMRKRLFETSDMHFNVYCIAPGQNNPLHRHPSSDEILYFTEGEGDCVVGLETFPVKPGDLVLVPKNVPHSIRNTHPTTNMVCILAQTPLPCEHVAVKPEELERYARG
ncbi:MAG: cupin domain-containing protein [Candidatus Lambdaproteobacteria bacterium]|nr:cupin domain-containing protein [Candidatus Lambdaproteobacteria bacterium]